MSRASWSAARSWCPRCGAPTRSTCWSARGGWTGSAAADAAVAACHASTLACLRAERAAVRELEASCHAPVGVHAEHDAESWHIRGFAGLPDGSSWVIDEIVAGDHDAEAAGLALARRMAAAGARDLLRDAEAMTR